MVIFKASEIWQYFAFPRFDRILLEHTAYSLVLARQNRDTVSHVPDRIGFPLPTAC